MSEVKLFENQQVRSVWDNEQEEWLFSVIDIVAILTESDKPRDYWYRVKKRMSDEERSELSTICRQLKLKSSDGKFYKTDVADMQGILRIIQSIPSPKAEPFKMWLAEVGKERLDEIVDPELTIDRALQAYLQKGYSREWINQRLQAIQVRKELTDTWQDHGVQAGREYAILTDEITQAWSGMKTREYKDFKGLKKENLRDNMSTTELVLNMLAEAATKDITQISHPQGLEANRQVAKRGGNVAKIARQSLEQETGQPVITRKNAIDFARLLRVVSQKIEDKSNK
ncbi:MULTISPECIES: BRO family protein [Rodentibacter]|uniref:BRO family protein n=1 Tax=Rodentibacter TaxID=1960084 RepID=UPI001CFF2681|nr:BRO family protein [Rodentibacter sp. JRC1]GJI56779.1 phage antirepressor [Rodentibacter sp. JRC1]